MGFFVHLWEKNWVRLTVITVLVLLAFRFVLPAMAPFVIAVLFVLPLHPLLTKLHSRLKIPKGISAGLFLILFTGVALFLLWVLAARLVDILNFCTSNLDFLEDCCCKALSSVCSMIAGVLKLDGRKMEKSVLNGFFDIQKSAQNGWAPKLVDVSAEYMQVLGATLAFLIFTVIAIVLLAKDLEGIVDKVKNKSFFQRSVKAAAKIMKLLKIYLRAQLLIEFCIVLLSVSGLLLCQVEGAVFLGLAAGVLDILPFIGTGVILVPTAIWQFLTGKYASGIGCLGIYAACALLRQFMEPKLLGNKLNIYPVFLLLSVFFGIRIFGACGIFLGPISLFLIKEIYSEVRLIREE